MAIHSFPVSGTQDYSTRHDLLFAFTEFLIGTGFFTEVRASDGTTVALGAIAAAADLNNVGSHRVLRSKDGHEVAFWRRTVADEWTIIVAVSPGFVTGGDATTVPTAADEGNLVGSRATGSDPDAGIGNPGLYRFVADDSVDGQVYWGFGSFYSDFLRYGLFRVPLVRPSPDDADPDPALYLRETNGVGTWVGRSLVTGAWGSSAMDFRTPAPSPNSGRYDLFPVFVQISGQSKGVLALHRTPHRDGLDPKGVRETPRGYWSCEPPQAIYLGETEPDLAAAGFPASGQAYEVFPYEVLDDIAPSITNVSPAPPGPLTKTGAISFRLTDDTDSYALRELWIGFNEATSYDLVHDGSSFIGLYAAQSTVTPVTGGWDFSIARDNGWPYYGGTVKLRALVVDSGGNVVVVSA